MRLENWIKSAFICESIWIAFYFSESVVHVKNIILLRLEKLMENVFNRNSIWTAFALLKFNQIFDYTFYM